MHAPYYNRLRRKIEPNWNPPAKHQADGGAGARAIIQIDLASDGSVAGCHVLESSGNESFDTDAVSAVRASQPFDPPPHILVEADGLAHLHMGFRLDDIAPIERALPDDAVAR